MQILDKCLNTFTLGNQAEEHMQVDEIVEQIKLYWAAAYESGKITDYCYTAGEFIYILIGHSIIYKVELHNRNLAEMDFFGTLPMGTSFEDFKNSIQFIAKIEHS